MNCSLDGISTHRLQGGSRTANAGGAGLHQQIDDGSLAIKPGDVEHSLTSIAGSCVLAAGVDVCSTFNEQFHRIHREKIRDCGVHERRSARRINGIDVDAMI